MCTPKIISSFAPKIRIIIIKTSVQWWQKESGPSAILSKKEQTRVKRPNKSRKTVNLYLKYNMYK